MEGCKVGYCYREQPDGDWDSSWRFTAGDESDEYMNDPNNAGIYGLNTICNDNPDIIPLLHTPAPCAFEQDKNGVFQQIKDWTPEQDEEEPDMDILQQCQKWHENNEYQKIIDALEAIPNQERAPEIDMELARAYNNWGVIRSNRDALKKAIALLKPHEKYFDGDHYYTLVTMGMGAHRMNVPEELAEYKLERAELAIALPKDWKLKHDDLKNERWYWPVHLLKVLARLPIASDTWLGSGHTMDHEEDFAENTKLCAAILTGPQGTEEGSEVCLLPSGEEVNFYQVIPLYREELEYKLSHNAEALLDKMEGISFVTHTARPNAITRGTIGSIEEGDGVVEMDDASWHLETIQEKNLPVDELCAYNHMAIYLRWCMEHDLMGEEFLAEYGEVVQRIKVDPASVDLREFIRDELDGQLLGPLFNQKGWAFASYYYGEPDSPYFPSDIDNYAISIIGQERNYSDEIQDEAYLFIPFDEETYQAMAKVIEERFINWQGQKFDEDTLEPSDLAQAMMVYLDCECTYFPAMKDDDPIMAAYSYP